MLHANWMGQHVMRRRNVVAATVQMVFVTIPKLHIKKRPSAFAVATARLNLGVFYGLLLCRLFGVFKDFNRWLFAQNNVFINYNFR